MPKNSDPARPDDFWNRDEVVAQFASRPPDVRLTALIEEIADPASVRVLDIGCAGGRNTVLLAERGFDVHAIDRSPAMVAEVRRRLTPIVGLAEAERRVREAPMDDLSGFDSGSFDLVVSFGVLHCAGSWAEWQSAAREVVRVLRPGGRLLFSQFTPETDLTGEGVRPVPGEPHVFEGMPSGRATLLSPAELDAEMTRLGLRAIVPTTTGATETERGRRVSANAFYAKPPA